HDARAGQTEQKRSGTRHKAGRGKAFPHVEKKALYPSFKSLNLLRFGVEAFDNANAIQCFGEAPRNLGVDFSAFAENRPDVSKRFRRNQSENTYGHKDV